MSEGTARKQAHVAPAKAQELQELIRLAVRAELQELRAECEYTSSRVDEIMSLLQIQGAQAQLVEYDAAQGDDGQQGLIEKDAIYEMEEDGEDSDVSSWVSLPQRDAQVVIGRRVSSEPDAIILKTVRPNGRGVKA